MCENQNTLYLHRKTCYVSKKFFQLSKQTFYFSKMTILSMKNKALISKRRSYLIFAKTCFRLFKKLFYTKEIFTKDIFCRHCMHFMFLKIHFHLFSFILLSHFSIPSRSQLSELHAKKNVRCHPARSGCPMEDFWTNKCQANNNWFSTVTAKWKIQLFPLGYRFLGDSLTLCSIWKCVYNPIGFQFLSI